MADSFRDRRVMITGASSGIGAALARELAERGARLALVARRKDRMLALIGELGVEDRAQAFECDLYDPSGREELAETVRENFGAPDVLILNAGTSQRSLVEETSFDAVRKLMELNFFATVHLAQMFLPDMLAQRGGNIAVVSSVVGYVATPKRSVYSASKHALHGFFEALRAEVLDRGVRVHLICPGYVQTEIGEGSLTASGQPRGPGAPAPARGISAQRCARAILRAIEKGRRETYVGGREVAAIYLRRYLPDVLARFTPRAAPR